LNVGQSTNKQQTINNQRIAAFRSVNRGKNLAFDPANKYLSCNFR
jgi:hypothetical protein